MFSRIFIDRPILAWVMAIIIMMAGAGSIMGLPIAQYPDVAPPQVTIQANYPGASAQTIQNSITQIVEQSLSGIDGMLYFQSSSSSRGQVTITVTFAKGVNPDIAQVQVQNQVQQVLSRLPTQVQQQGLVVRKSNPDNLLIIGLYDQTDRMTNRDVADYLVTYIQYPVSRIQGVGNTNVYGAQYAMRIWLDPDLLASYQLMPSDVITAVQAQNAQVAAGELGAQPQPPAQMLDATVTAQSMLQTPEEFAKIVVKSTQGGAAVLLSDVARVELGSDNYLSSSRVDQHPGAGLAILLAPGADALKTATLVKAQVATLSKALPPGLKIAYANDTTTFIKLSITEVVKTLVAAIALVVVVMFVFLQSWRATLVPAIAVPVVLLGTFGVLYLAGFSINTMTLFGMVLAIGLLVDDAIVVVENVERLMDENPEMTPRDATVASMNQISMALVAIALVLSAVFLPMAFFGGSTGVIYRQFSLTIIAAMALSAFVALTLSPALAAHLLKQKHMARETHEGWFGRRFPAVARVLHAAASGFNRGFERFGESYQRAARWMLGRKGLFLLIYVAVVVVLALLFLRLPTGFLPTEDQGAISLQFQLPSGATQSRTIAVQRQIENYFYTHERKNITTMFTVTGGGGVAGQNTGQGFLNLAPFSQRTSKADSAGAIVARASAAFKNFRDARVYVLIPAAVRGLGQTSGFTMELQNANGMSQTEFAAARDRLLATARADPTLTAVRLTELPDMNTLKVAIDARKLAALGLTQSNVNTTLSAAWGGIYVNDFLDRGRVKKVYVQADWPYRAQPSNLYEWYVRGTAGSGTTGSGTTGTGTTGTTGAMAPFSSFATISWTLAPTTLSRFNGISSYEFNGSAAPGGSSGQAMTTIAQLATQIPGTSYAWSGLSYQEQLSTGQAPILYGLSLLVVFLCLAALYESWSVPAAVLLVVPLGLVGAVLAVTLRGLVNDVYMQLGLLTTMGLTAKNAILIVEFAEQADRQGKPVVEAAMEAARTRLRPILMTSLAFVFGVLPMAIATGAGANSRIAIGTAVVGGMLTATVLVIFYVPLFFVLVRQGFRGGVTGLRGGRRAPPPPPPPEPPPEPEPERA